MRKILTQTDPPFVLLILLAAFSWATTHVVTRTIERPTIAFDLKQISAIPNDIIYCSPDSTHKDKNEIVQRFKIINISKDHLFKNVSFLVTKTNGKIYGVRKRAISPADSGQTKESCSDEHGLFNDITLHPDWRFQFDVVTSRNTRLELRLIASDDAIYLTESNFETFLVKNETLILAIFLSAIVLICIAYFGFLVFAAKENSQNGNDNFKPQGEDGVIKKETSQ